MLILRRVGEFVGSSIIPMELLTFGLIVSWLLAALGPLSFSFPLFAITFVIWCALKGYWLIALIFPCLLPTSFSAYQALRDYRTGDVLLRYSGLPDTTFFNIDPDYRCENTTCGCVVNGAEWVYQAPYNVTAKYLISSFGFAPGSYLGPYPTAEEAVAALADAPSLDPLAFAKDRLELPNQTVTLDAMVGLRLLRACGYDIGRDGRIEGVRARTNVMTAQRWKTGCIVVQKQHEWHHQRPHAMIAVIDAERGRPFAYYAVGEYYHRFPPVSWKERRPN